MEVQLRNHSQSGRDFNLLSPFSNEILSESIPSRFKMPMVESFDGFTNPLDHFEGFKAIMRLQGASDVLLCIAISISLKKSTRI